MPTLAPMLWKKSAMPSRSARLAFLSPDQLLPVSTSSHQRYVSGSETVRR